MNQPRTDLSETLTAMAGTVPGIRHALQVSGDGLLMASTDGMPRDLADTLSAAVTGLGHLAAGVARVLEGASTQHISIDYHDAQLLIVTAGDGSLLAALGTGEAEMGDIGKQLAMLADRLAPAAALSA
ncbi:roadblock/LC7 domain-containing protein [Kitasatospora sp. NPDC001261]|uniref:roadblock/LC7 domain-containing protein n=1 Tax=Kitasatospora sp. NPDC001261 TaxID=3364012 RepID=UPI0036C74B6F